MCIRIIFVFAVYGRLCLSSGILPLYIGIQLPSLLVEELKQLHFLSTDFIHLWLQFTDMVEIRENCVFRQARDGSRLYVARDINTFASHLKNTIFRTYNKVSISLKNVIISIFKKVHSIKCFTLINNYCITIISTVAFVLIRFENVS